jgi:hypothetical protein
MTKKIRIYVSQYGSIYSLKINEWVSIVKEAVKTGSYELTSKRLKSKPACLRIDGYGHYYSIQSDKELIEPLDWDCEDFKNWAESHYEEMAA